VQLEEAENDAGSIVELHDGWWKEGNTTWAVQKRPDKSTICPISYTTLVMKFGNPGWRRAEGKEFRDEQAIADAGITDSVHAQPSFLGVPTQTLACNCWPKYGLIVTASSFRPPHPCASFSRAFSYDFGLKSSLMTAFSSLVCQISPTTLTVHGLFLKGSCLHSAPLLEDLSFKSLHCRMRSN